MFSASDVIKCHFDVHTESQESSSLLVAKHFLHLCLAKLRLNAYRKIYSSAKENEKCLLQTLLLVILTL